MYFKTGVEKIGGKNKNIYQMEGSRKKYIKFRNRYIDIGTYKKSLKKKRGKKGGARGEDGEQPVPLEINFKCTQIP